MSQPDRGKAATPERKAYWCFISYRHSDNKEPGRQWATWLHQAIETYEVPEDLVGTVNDRGDTIPARIFPVFRDEEELPVDADLASPIYRALDTSKFLVVICSPRAVASSYVGSEIRYFKQLGYGDRVLAVMIEGEPNASWDAGKQAQGSRVEDECFPEALRHKVASDGSLLSEQTEPIAADFRIGNKQGWTSPEAHRLSLGREGLRPKAIDAEVEDYRKRCELMKLKVIAGILGVSLGTLTKRDKAYQLVLAQKRAKALRRWLVAVGLLAMLAVLGGWYAWRNAEKTVETLSQSDFLHSVELINQGKNAEALAYLARAVRADPRNHAALARLYTLLLSQHTWPIPAVKVMRHADNVRSAQFSPDGTRIVTTSYDKTARIWDARTGQPIGVPMQHENDVTYAVFSPDGARVVTCCGDDDVHRGYAQVWDAATCQPVGKQMRHNDEVNSVSFSPDGARVVTASKDKTARVWDAGTGLPLGEPMSNPAGVTSASFSGDGTRLVTFGIIFLNSGFAQVWDAHTCRPVGLPIHHQAWVNAAGFSPDGTLVVTASSDKTARLWDARTGQAVGAPMQHAMEVNSATFSPDGTRLLTASMDHTAQVWDVHTGKTIGEAMHHEDGVLSAVFSPDGKRVVTASDDKTAQVWDARTGLPIEEPMLQESAVVSAVFSPDGRYVLTASRDKTARLWDVRIGQEFNVPLRHDDEVNSAIFSPDGSTVVTASKDKTARLWDARTGRPMGEPMRHYEAINAAAFSPDGTRLVTASRDHMACVWNARTGQLIGEPMRHDGEVHTASFSPDGTRVVTASDDNCAQVWNAQTGEPMGEPMEHFHGVNSATFSPDGTRIVTASGDRFAQMWDARTGQRVGVPMPCDMGVVSAAFSPDGARVITASNDNCAQVWDAQTGKPMGEPMRHESGIATASFSPDGLRVTTASFDKTARLWNPLTGHPIGEPMRHQSSVVFAAFSPDATRVITASDDKTARIWDAETGQPISDPMRHDEEVNMAGFSPDGTGVVTASSDFNARLWDILPPNLAVTPDWLPDLAEAVGGQVLSDSSAPEPVDLDRFFKLKARLGAAPGDDFWSKAGRWFFADRETRTISPQSPVTLPDYHARESESAKKAPQPSGSTSLPVMAEQAPVFPKEDQHQLAPGKTPGTYAFSLVTNVIFTQEPAFPVTVAIKDLLDKAAVQVPVKDTAPFMIAADLAPGGYLIQSSVAPEQARIYSDSQTVQMFINPAGVATIQPHKVPLRHRKIVTLLRPDPQSTAPITERRPLLTWQALPGADGYAVMWISESVPGVFASHAGNERTHETQLQMTEDVVANRRYGWFVDAVGKNDETLGRSSPAFFFTPGGREIFAKTETDGKPPSKGKPFLGISLFRNYGDKVIGINVMGVLAGSPAMKAGLQPDDVLTSFDGKSLAKATVVEFIGMSTGKAVGSVVPIEFMRQGVKKTVNVTMEAMP